jgi:uncharacterized protein
MILTQINIYPVKSLDGFSPQTAIVEGRGLQYDRRWVLVDESGTFMSQRTTRKMTQLRAIIEDDNLTIFVKNEPSQRVSIPIAAEGEMLDVSVWDDTTQGMKISSAADIFLSDFLETKCYLVKMPEIANRRVEEQYNTGNDIVSYADGFPFLIIGEASINDLNQRLDVPLNPDNQPLEGMRRFRTNFVFSNGIPYEEDHWRDFKIGNVDFIGCKPCGRCVMTTLDPDTGERNNEPLQTLATYRKEGKRIKFGQNVVWNSALWIADTKPMVSVGDTIRNMK